MAATSGWSTQQLAEFVAAVSAFETAASAGLGAVERAAEALDAEVAAIVAGGAVIASVGYPAGHVPADDLGAVAAGRSGELAVPGVGPCAAVAVPLDHPPEAMLVVARSGPEGLSSEEIGVLHGMARVTSMTLRILGLLDEERALREQSERQAAEVARLLAELTERQADLAASRLRVVAAADEMRRRIERNLHDGTQQRLVTLALKLRSLHDELPAGLPGVDTELSYIEDGLTGLLEELREISRGLHPPTLSDYGLTPALRSLARRAALPVELDVRFSGRLPEPIEVAAYYVVSEALANAAKHAGASGAEVELELVGDERLAVLVNDDGSGGADPAGGSGLIGLRDRVEALGGTMILRSPPGGGTALLVELPLAGP
jgi:signal transduction histidine kinase